ncbi:unnamed protein product, partial [Hapterophycus canaliculatus]
FVRDRAAKCTSMHVRKTRLSLFSPVDGVAERFWHLRYLYYPGLQCLSPAAYSALNFMCEHEFRSSQGLDGVGGYVNYMRARAQRQRESTHTSIFAFRCALVVFS